MVIPKSLVANILHDKKIPFMNDGGMTMPHELHVTGPWHIYLSILVW